jgi:hypothetical protein
MADELEWDPPLVERVARTTEGAARARWSAYRELTGSRHGRPGEPSAGSRAEQHGMLAASGLAIAASHWSLLDPKRARVCFLDAMQIYHRLDHSYWMALALCSSDGKAMDLLAREIPAQADRPSLPTDALAFMIVAESVPRLGERMAGLREALGRHLRVHGNRPVGRLGVPLEEYLRCRDTLQRASSQDPGRFSTVVGAFMHRATEPVRLAMHDRFHWSRLRSSVLPVEPEALAVAMTAVAVSLLAYDQVPRMPDLDPAAGRVMRVAERLVAERG